MNSFISFLKRYAIVGLLLAIVFLLFFITISALYSITNAFSIIFLLLSILSIIWFVVYGVLLGEEYLHMFFKRKAFRRGIETFAIVIIVTGILVLIYLIASNRGTKIDLTKEKLLTLSSYTKEFLKKLDKDVEIVAFISPDDYRAEMVKKLLEEYKKFSGHIKLKFYDPVRNKSVAESYGIRENLTVIFSCEGNRKYVVGTDIFRMSTRRGEPIWVFQGETEFTSAIRDIVEAGPRKVYFIEGYGERSIEDKSKDGYSEIKELLEKANYNVQRLNISLTRGIPKDASAIVIARPLKMYTPDDEDKIARYIKYGGRALILLDPIYKLNADIPLLNVLIDWGVVIPKNNLVIDLMRSVQTFSPTFIIPNPAPGHPVTKSIREKGMYVMLPEAIAFKLERKLAPEGTVLINVLNTSEEAWGETTLKRTEKGDVEFIPEKGKEDILPSEHEPFLTVGVAISKVYKFEEGKEVEKGFYRTEETRIVVIGDSDFASNAFIYLASANADLFIYALDWLVGRDISIPVQPKEITVKRVRLTFSEARMTMLAISSIPILLLIVWLTVFIYKRYLIKRGD